MRFLYALAALACTAAAQTSNVQAVRNDIANITTLMATLSSDVKLVKPGSAGIAQALQVQVDAVNIHKRLLTSIDDTESSAPFGAGGSLSIGLDFIGLSPKVKTTLQDVTKQKAALGELGIVVLSSLYQLKQDTDTFGAAVLEKLDALEKAIAPAIIKDLDKAFNDAIVAYGGKAT
ncbi:hydrophobic surface binding protein A domain-containing protein [Pochonia chlamydosporia 170]|uniref:Hydrophobic surface binding protein A domain-containing protein n=1 Tax=Pochonia chlamydosporia 170 TaxID=1380566 RepID=A0A179F507_METCM|nr:hydrophobic surface binding protein A domain-containing protein [Pochonia chlamydosporia 170]OAQ60431.1 hydrophobic surface binding protein A domain-containing protein [Pochonia chlamydosporia 170]